jgi:hypothetical protein
MVLRVLRGQVTFRVNRCGTTRSRRRDGLTVRAIHAISRREHAGHVGVRPFLAQDVSIGRQLNLPFE